MNSTNELVNYVAMQGMLYSSMQSCTGHNVQFLNERYKLCKPDILKYSPAIDLLIFTRVVICVILIHSFLVENSYYMSSQRLEMVLLRVQIID